jgi:hypothetical protein
VPRVPIVIISLLAIGVLRLLVNRAANTQVSTKLALLRFRLVASNKANALRSSNLSSINE